LTTPAFKTKTINARATGLLACLFVALAMPAGAAENGNFLKQGMVEYNAGDYNNASGHLGAALNTEFNNPVLHYYLASCYVHLNQKEAAIREFRIAYALQPDGDAGKLSKTALKYYGLDSIGADSSKDAKTAAGAKDPKTGLPIPGGTGTGATSTGTTATSTTGTSASGTAASAGTGSTGSTTGNTTTGTTATDTGGHAPSTDKMISTVRDQVEREKRMRLEESQKMADQTKQQGSSYIDKTTNEIKENMRSYYRGRYYDPTSLPDDARALLDRLKNGYDSQRSANLRAGNSQAAELDKSAQNLQDLLHDKARPGQPQLQPVGTSLYVRNYTSSPDSGNSKSTKPSTGSQPPAK
jgi:tetratricopeptide (TPR) repeat protein